MKATKHEDGLIKIDFAGVFPDDWADLQTVTTQDQAAKIAENLRRSAAAIDATIHNNNWNDTVVANLHPNYL